MIVLSDDNIEIGVYPGRSIETKNYKKQTKRSIKWSEVKRSGILRCLTEKLMSQLTYELNGYAAAIVNFKQIEEESRPSTKVKNEPAEPEIVFKEITPKFYLKSSEVETLYGISASTMANWRYKKIGPKYHKVGGSVRYKVQDLDQFMESRKVSGLV